MPILRFQSSEDEWGKEITEEQFETLKMMARKHGQPLDLFKIDPKLFDKLMMLRDMKQVTIRKVDFIVPVY